MKNIIISLSIVVSSFIFSGCAMDRIANEYSPENVERMLKRKISGDSQNKFVKSFSDKELAKEFALYYDKMGYSMDYTNNLFNIKKKLVYFSQNVYMGQADAYIKNSSGENEFSKKYKKIILKKGHKYKTFKGDFNKRLYEIILSRKVPSINNRKELMRWNLIPAIAEYNKNGELVSLMLNSVLIEAAYGKINNPNVQSEISLNISVFTANALNTVKNNVSMQEWDDNLIMESK
jgi:hypothetical protein